MTLLVVGLSHRSTPMPVLERVAMDDARARQLAKDLLATPQIAEVAVLSTCNRVEVYAEITAFHDALTGIGEALADAAGIPLAELTPHMYAHYAREGVHHLFTVAGGLDSMALGEAQILGQLRTTLRNAQEDLVLGRALGPLLQESLRVGKRLQADTNLGKAAPSLVTASLARAESMTAVPTQGACVLVLGAGAMSTLAATTARRLGAHVLVGNRTVGKAESLAAQVGGVGFGLDDSGALAEALAQADVVLSCTGAVGHVLTPDQLPAQRRPHLVLVDLALPHDLHSELADAEGVSLFGLAELGTWLEQERFGLDLAQARQIIDDEVAHWESGRAAESVTPTVVALRSAANDVVEAELARLRNRLPQLDSDVEVQLEQTVRRVVEKLLHAPTVRMRTLAERGGGSYATVLQELFDLQVPPPSVADLEPALAANLVVAELIGGRR